MKRISYYFLLFIVVFLQENCNIEKDKNIDDKAFENFNLAKDKNIDDKALENFNLAKDKNIDDKALEYFNAGKYEEAILEYKKKLPLIEKKYGKNDTTHYSKTLYDTGICFYYLQNYKKAIEYLTECNKVYKSINALQNEFYAKSCNDLGLLYNYIGNYEKAEKFYIESKNILEKILGKEHHHYATTCNDLGLLYSKIGNYEKAKKLYIESKNIKEKILGKEHPDYANTCNNLGVLYYNIGNYKKAEKFYIESKNIREKIFGKERSDYANSCYNLGKLYKSIGNYKKAEKFYIESKNTLEKILGKELHHYATTCNSLGGLYDIMGNDKKAEKLLIESKNIREKILGKEHLDYASSCNNLGSLYLKIGNYEKAKKFYIESKNIFEKILGKEHTYYAVSCNNFGGLYKKIGNYEKAEKLYIESKNIYEKILGKEHPSYATSCNNLGGLYYEIGNYEKAEIFFIETKNIREKILGKEHPSYALSCNNLGALYKKIGNYEKAEKLYIESKNILEKTFGKEHPHYSNTCNNLGELYDKIENYERAEKLYIEMNELMTLLSDKSAKFMSEKEREKYFKSNINQHFEKYHSFFLKKRNKNKKLVSIIYDNALNIKGQLLRATIAVRRTILESGDSSLIQVYTKMNNLGKIVASESALPIAKRRKDLKEMEEKYNILEKELINQSQEFAEISNRAKVNWKDIQKSLEKDETAIEFIHFNFRDEKGLIYSTFYYALVLRKDYKYPKAIYLFEEKELKKELKKNKISRKRINNLYATRSFHTFEIPIKKDITKIDSLIWLPIEKELNGVKKVYLSLSGLLNKVSFASIPYGDTLLLSDKYEIIHTSSTAMILENTEFNFSEINKIALFGGIKYSITEEELKKANKKYKKTENRMYFKDEKFRRCVWKYLPETMKEIENISDFLNEETKIKYETYSGSSATEETFKSFEKNSPSIFHIATHGFYFPKSEIDLKKNNNTAIIGGDKIPYKYSDNPLVRSGLLLSGGATSWSGENVFKDVEDGVLSAYETSNLNFFGIKLVVLSACQTGLGDVKGSEGVFGLQRAFKMAGVDYIIMSLWDVPDVETQEFMSLFYANWKSEREIKKAFYKTQKFMRKKYAGNPYKWGAFVLIN